ncbi:hypothetical protein O9929_25635 [Vibrio lentus]|nr:hypothetical protein [Vibrio lentus]
MKFHLNGCDTVPLPSFALMDATDGKYWFTDWR